MRVDRPESEKLAVDAWRPEKVKSDGTHKHDFKFLYGSKVAVTFVCRSCARVSAFYRFDGDRRPRVRSK